MITFTRSKPYKSFSRQNVNRGHRSECGNRGRSAGMSSLLSTAANWNVSKRRLAIDSKCKLAIRRWEIFRIAANSTIRVPSWIWLIRFAATGHIFSWNGDVLRCRHFQFLNSTLVMEIGERAVEITTESDGLLSPGRQQPDGAKSEEEAGANLNSLIRCLYSSHFLSRWGDRYNSFANLNYSLN